MVGYLLREGFSNLTLVGGTAVKQQWAAKRVEQRCSAITAMADLICSSWMWATAGRRVSFDDMTATEAVPERSDS